jgi:hypothetical protein
MILGKVHGILLVGCLCIRWGKRPVTMAMDQRNTILISHLVPPSKVLREVGGS